MAYSDYRACVRKNGVRRLDKEDAFLFEDTRSAAYHGVMGDGDIRVACYKQYLPQIFKRTKDGCEEIPFVDEYTDRLEFGTIYTECDGYLFEFRQGDLVCFAMMTEPDGTKWTCNYGYGIETEDE